MGVVCNAIVVFALAYGFFRLLDRLMGNRVPAEVEWTGLDSFEMGSQAYPHAHLHDVEQTEHANATKVE
jgi:ammonia channel protein AmtB